MTGYKRAYDLTVILAAGLLLLPVWVLLWLAIPVTIRLCHGGPVFYTQTRLGRHGRPFRIIKFRTMVPDAERGLGPVWAVPGDPRVTRVGRFLRATELDELPQVINVLRGEMSLVGPRPERPELTAGIEAELPAFRERLAAPPGIAGLAHVYGDSHTPPRNRLRYDRLYLTRMGPWLDTRILLLSLWVVARRVLRGKRTARKESPVKPEPPPWSARATRRSPEEWPDPAQGPASGCGRQGLRSLGGGRGPCRTSGRVERGKSPARLER